LLRSRLNAAKEKYTPNHPDVRALEAELSAMENQLAGLEKRGVRGDPQNQKTMLDLQGSMNVLKTEMRNANQQMEEKQRQLAELNRQIGAYQQRIEASPQLEQQDAALNRDYALARQNYEDLLRKVEASREASRIGASRTGGRTTGPMLVFRREPEYTDEARKARIQGTVELSVTIGTDGVARDIRVIRGLDAGLDQKAMECVAGWRFRPASRDGEPIPAFAAAEVKFTLLMK
jgi:TonB family protein